MAAPLATSGPAWPLPPRVLCAGEAPALALCPRAEEKQGRAPAAAAPFCPRAERERQREEREGAGKNGLGFLGRPAAAGEFLSMRNQRCAVRSRSTARIRWTEIKPRRVSALGRIRTTSPGCGPPSAREHACRWAGPKTDGWAVCHPPRRKKKKGLLKQAGPGCGPRQLDPPGLDR